MIWGFFYSYIDECSSASERTGVYRRKMPEPESPVDIRLSCLGIGDLTIILVD